MTSTRTTPIADRAARIAVIAAQGALLLSVAACERQGARPGGGDRHTIEYDVDGGPTGSPVGPIPSSPLAPRIEWPVEHIRLLPEIQAAAPSPTRPRGLRLGVEAGAFVLSVADGIVTEVERESDARYRVSVAHADALTSEVSGLATVLVVPGMAVSRAAPLGTAGGPGTRAAIELRMRLGKDAVDPLILLGEPWPEGIGP